MMLNGPLKIYKDYQIVPKPVEADFATIAIEYCFKKFFQRYTVGLSKWRHLFYHIHTNGYHQKNHKEILNKPGGTN